jgi:hypothetical protein
MSWILGLVAASILGYFVIIGVWYHGRADGIRWATEQVYGNGTVKR